MSEAYDRADAEYWAHKKVCTMPYDPYRIPRQCPECGRLIELVLIAIVIDGCAEEGTPASKAISDRLKELR